MAPIIEEPKAGRDRLHKELDQLLELLAAQRRNVQAEVRKSKPVIQKGDTAEAQFVLAAQQRLKRGGGHQAIDLDLVKRTALSRD